MAELENTQRFQKIGDRYAASRPDYPEEIVAALAPRLAAVRVP